MNLEYKTLYKQEIVGNHSLGIEVRVSLHRPVTEADERAARNLAAKLVEALEMETARLDPDVAVEREVERQALVGLFEPFSLTGLIFVEEIPNGYCSQPCCSQKPWFTITTRKGRVTLGWRKRVIEIRWEPSVAGLADVLFPTEDVTKEGRSIHAWGYDKAKLYIQRLLSQT